ncbi:MAG: arginine--tRNA ligase [Deltaproteobacteria bacterium]|nr:arginine--tRNA ligase [Deltaproteobacteria bacterium]
MIEQRLSQVVTQAFAACQEAGEIPRTVVCPPIHLERPRQSAHGDLATNIALVIAKAAKRSPRAIAEALVARMPSDPHLQGVSVAGPGFINFDLIPTWFVEQLTEIIAADQRYGCTNIHQGERCQVEFVSANPTGPLHVGHGRNAILGDVLGNLLAAVGYQVTKEYYVNDTGVQIETLGRSVLCRLRELQGEKAAFPAECYQGSYIIDIAQQLQGDGTAVAWQTLDERAQSLACGRYAADRILRGITDDLAACGVVHDRYFLESALHVEGAIPVVIEQLRHAGHLYEQDDALWFRSTAFGDDKDRVIRKSDGSLTYFAADIAYHARKYVEGFSRVVDVLGADHAGYVPRMKAVVAALGHDAGSLDYVLTQLVNLTRGGEVVSMSTRRGEYETLARLIAEVGRDVTRYFYLMRSHTAQLDFDLALATAQTLENPVYYVQYAHARICSIFAKAEATGAGWRQRDPLEASQLDLEEERALARLVGEYPGLIRAIAEELAPHRLTVYLLEVARTFQSYYTRGKQDPRYRVLGQALPKMQAKLSLLHCLRIVIRNGLGLLGISAPERMNRIEGDAAHHD